MEPSSSSILDKILESQHAQEAMLSDILGAMQKLLDQLPERDRTILSRRFALSGQEPETLKEIGESLGVTRERVRQIEHSALAELKRYFRLDAGEDARSIERAVRVILEEHGGALTHYRLVDKAIEMARIANPEVHETSLRHHTYVLHFMLDHLFVDVFHPIEETEDIHQGWRLPSHQWSATADIINAAHEILNQNAAAIEHEAFLSRLNEKFMHLNPTILHEQLHFTKKIKKNLFDHWGLISWKEIVPKRMNDKIYLIMRNHGKPLHFTEIAQKINEAKFDAKVAHPSTIHNELIFDKKYVLVGRGIYALQEWGYQRGVVVDVIRSVIRDAGRALTRDAIVEKVLAQRLVRKSTVHLALTNRACFTRLPEGTYDVVKDTASSSAEESSSSNILE